MSYIIDNLVNMIKNEKMVQPRQNADKSAEMAMTKKGVKQLLIGLIVMISGYILMMGGGVKDPEVFNYAMFDFQRLVAAPIVIVLGIVIEIISIMGWKTKVEK